MITLEIETMMETEIIVNQQREAPGFMMVGIIIEAGGGTEITMTGKTEASSPALMTITGAINITTTQLDRDQIIIITDTVILIISSRTEGSMMIPDSPDTTSSPDTKNRTTEQISV